MGENNLSEESAVAICEMLSENTTLTTLQLFALSLALMQAGG